MHDHHTAISSKILHNEALTGERSVNLKFKLHLACVKHREREDWGRRERDCEGRIRRRASRRRGGGRIGGEVEEK